MRAMAKQRATKKKIAPSRELRQHEQNRENPIVDDVLCHIASGDGRTSYCGCVVEERPTCTIYEGEEICPSCGRVTCPMCATISELHWELVKDEDDES